MVKWQHELNMVDIWATYKDPELGLTPQQISKAVADRIKSKWYYKKYFDDLEQIVCEFETLSEDPDTTIDDFDSVLSDLYDWGDQSVPTRVGEMQRKMCWIKTF